MSFSVCPLSLPSLSLPSPSPRAADPKMSAGVLLANISSPMQNILFDNVVVNNPASKPFGKDGYYCKNAQGRATGTTSPVPPCFKDDTN